MNKICGVLKPFADATYITQGNKRITISDAVPTTFDLNGHLKKCPMLFSFVVLYVIPR